VVSYESVRNWCDRFGAMFVYQVKAVRPRTQRFLSCFGPIRQHFALYRHRMSAVDHRAQLGARVVSWFYWTVTEPTGIAR